MSAPAKILLIDDDAGIEFGNDNPELNRSDILLPSLNVGDDLGREVTAPMVTDPETGGMVNPNAEYLGQLARLAGLNSSV